MWLFIFLVWLLCAAVCGALAQNKGLNAALWSVLGFLLGPFAVLFVAVAAPDENAQNKLGQADRRPCVDCGEYIANVARKCRFCGAEFTDEQIRIRQAERAVQVQEANNRNANSAKILIIVFSAIAVVIVLVTVL